MQGRNGRETGMNIWTGLLFLEGAIADPRSAHRHRFAARRIDLRCHDLIVERETTMNVFKGVLYLLESSPTPIDFNDAPHYGAATAANEFGRPLGNRAASERWFGPLRDRQDAPRDTRLAAASCR
jgi:hypothetical protein